MLAVIAKSSRPQRIVTACFSLVFLCASLLLWREGMILEQAYIANQRNSLDSVVTAFDKQLQHSVDILYFYQQAMVFALDTPFIGNTSHPALLTFNRLRQQPDWRLTYNMRRMFPIYGVSDQRLADNPLLERDPAYLAPELSALLELGYLLPLSQNDARFQFRSWYVSRAGMFVSSDPNMDDKRIADIYMRMVARPYFVQQQPVLNPARHARWSFNDDPDHASRQVVTVSVPLDWQQRWYGVIGMDFTLEVLHHYLQNMVASQGQHEGTVFLLDSQLKQLTTGRETDGSDFVLSQPDRMRLLSEMHHGSHGTMRSQRRFITWARLDSFDGILLREQSLREGIQGEFGRITLVLVAVWLLFTLLLVGVWYLIRRVVINMSALQNTLTWRANYDTLTRLFNRGAFFDHAQSACATCRQTRQPVAVVQIDLDYFKKINDTWGHQVGDKVLKHAAGLISNTIRGADIAGRVGGEEFCIVMPGASHADAARIAERIRLRIYRKEILITAGQVLRISASFGIASASEHDDYDFEHLQSLADKRLYMAKQSGRNQVCTQG